MRVVGLIVHLFVCRHTALHFDSRPRWPAAGPLDGWPPLNAPTWANRGQREEVPLHTQCAALTPESFLNIGDQLRSCADVLFNGGARPPLMESQIDSTLRMLDTWNLCWRQAMGTLRLPSEVSKYRHSSKRILRAITLASEIRGGSGSLHKVVAQSLAAALPEFMQSSFLNDVLDPNAALKSIIPSAALVSRYELSLDIAMLLLQRDLSRRSSQDQQQHMLAHHLSDGYPEPFEHGRRLFEKGLACNVARMSSESLGRIPRPWEASIGFGRSIMRFHLPRPLLHLTLFWS